MDRTIETFDWKDINMVLPPKAVSPNKAVVLVSGGLDSATLLANVVDNIGSMWDKVIALSIIYGQKHVWEIQSAKKLAAWYGVRHVIREIPNIFEGGGSTLIDSDKPNPEMSYKEINGAKGVSPTYVPYRNGILLSLAAAIALVEGADRVYYGAHADDANEWAYPDCTPAWIAAQNRAIEIGTYFKVSLEAPWAKKTKMEIVQIAVHNFVPIELTWSCYNGREKHCGVCPTCVSRIQAFKEAGYIDPVPYAIDIDWEGALSLSVGGK